MKVISRKQLLVVVMLCVAVLALCTTLSFNVQKAECKPVNAEILAQDSMNASHPYGLYDTLDDAYAALVENIYESRTAHFNNLPVIVEIPNSPRGIGFATPNISQSTMNGAYNNANNTNYTGTCSIVAMTSMLESLSAFCDDDFDIFDDRDACFSELLNYSLASGNNYTKDDGIQDGTDTATFANIINSYFAAHVPGFNVSYYQDGNRYDPEYHDNYYSSIGAVNYDTFVPLGIITMENYSGTGCHSMVLNGAFRFFGCTRIIAGSGNQRIPILLATSYIVFRVCNGWYDCNDGSDGYSYNYQYLVLEESTPFWYFTFNWDDLVFWLDF